ncbi:MAG: hypothetical protein JW910_17930 [Anaerolineae bacterium]|nr:hypothetical protein [Anaerolineae bacterium]
MVEAYFRPGDARDLGVGWERIVFDWAQFQPDGPDDFRTDVIPESWLLDARDNGREVVGLLKSTPFWASNSPKIGAPPNGLDLPIDDPHNYWAAFVARTVQYYGETWGVNHWIILNEPDIRPGDMDWYEFDGEVEDYYQMVKVAYLAAKQVNPDAVIHLAGMAWWPDGAVGRQPYLARLLEVASNDPEAYANGFFFDVVMAHVYFGTQNSLNMLTDIRSILKWYGLHEKAIWIDEMNASPTLDPYTMSPGTMYPVTLREQANYIVQASALSLASGVERLAIYRLYDNHFLRGVSESWGLVRADGTRRPAFDAYRTVIEWLGDTTGTQRFYTDNSAIVLLAQPDRTVYVMWARRRIPVQFYLFASDPDQSATRVLLDGTTQPVQAVQVAGVPNHWYAATGPGAPGVVVDSAMVEGEPMILVVDGPPVRSLWVDVEGMQWQLY